MFKKIIVLLLLTIPVKFIYAETISFNINNFKVENQKISCKTKDYIQTTNRDYNFITPIFNEFKFNENQNIYPQKLIIKSIKKTAISVLQKINKKQIKEIELPNQQPNPISLSSFGSKRGRGAYTLTYSPFVFSNDSLFFINQINYELTDFKTISLDKPKGIFEKKDLLIITSDKFLNILNRYAEFKEKTKVQTQIATIEDINNSTTGNTIAEKIRNYITEIYLQKDIDFVLLAGGDEVIPAVKFDTNPSTNNPLASDQFYSNLDGDFDANNNGIYCELSDNVDYYPDVFVGRFPGNSLTQMNTIVNKTLKYYTAGNREESFYNSLNLFAFDLWQSGDTEGYCENIKNHFLPSIKADSLYQKNSSISFTHDNAMNYLNNGSNMLYCHAHGVSDKISEKNGLWAIFSDEIYQTEKFSGLYYICSCHPGDYSLSAFSHKAMISKTGGCINYIGSSSTEYPGFSFTCGTKFFGYINASKKSYGESLTLARIEGFSNINSYSHYRMLYFAYNLMGDPSNFPVYEPQNQLEITNLSPVFKGEGILSGDLSEMPIAPMQLVLFDLEGNYLASTNTNSNHFSLKYSNLNTDSVNIVLSSLDNYIIRENKLATEDNAEQFDIDLSVRDENNSGIVEKNEIFGLNLSITTKSNINNLDSLAVFIVNSETIPNVSVFEDSTKIKIPITSDSLTIPIFNLKFNGSMQSDSTISFNLMVKSTSTGKVFYTKQINISAANPHLNLGWVNFSDNNSIVNTTILNQTNAFIDSAKIELISDNKKKTLTSVSYTLRNIPANFVLKDSLIFPIYKNTSYKLQIKINKEDIYYTDIFQKSNITNGIISTTIVDNINSKQIEWNYNNQNNDTKYNIYTSMEDSTNQAILLNKYPIKENSYIYKTDILDDEYIQVSAIDENYNEVVFSPFYKINFIKFYKDSPLKLSEFQLFEPFVTGDKIIANSHNSSVYGVDYNLNPWGNDENLIYQTDDVGISSESTHQGYAVGDINHDGNLDMVEYFRATGSETKVKIIDLVTGNLIGSISLFGIPYNNAPVINNFDEDDNLEIFIPLFDLVNTNSSKSMLYLLDFSNNELVIKDGFPLESNYGAYYINSPSVLDLDTNGSQEIIYNSGSRVLIYDKETLIKQHEFDLGNKIDCSLQFVDIDDDQKYEIIATIKNTDLTSKLLCYEYNGISLDELTGWEGGKILDRFHYEYEEKIREPVFGDLNNDHKLEIITLTGKKIYVFNEDGSNYPGFPLDIPNLTGKNGMSSPTLADFDGDNFLDILFTDLNYNIWCYSTNPDSQYPNNLLPGFPIQVPDMHRVPFRSICTADLDNDGDLEFMTGNYSGNLFVYDYPLATSDRNIYSNYRADLYNSGVFNRSVLCPIKEKHLPNKFSLISQYPNPFNPETTIKFMLPNKGAVSFAIFNSKGEIVFKNKRQYVNSGTKEFKLNGANLSSGMYIYQIKFNDKAIIGKCVLLK